MKILALAAAAATALLTSAASAAPLAVQTSGIAPTGTEQVRLVCDEYGRCFRSRPRYVEPRYGYRGGYERRGYGHRQGYYGGGGPSIGLGFGGGRW
ncbi:hypothetical protein HNR60_002995 [Rhodopseudomonas rhenobacensis]|uniref:Uncharacterized protein n=1 Tax=Rhodopseudomonas rhenobacensis TaxID=87461 RepID=A0A7W7Z580_9BRAD|nr:hypothetical protein [Rhodopseudomonas rhenobacensis]MBB5048233.1 hypothetical protein [Rhodopseudomonas rhenobacensis]